MREPGDCWRLSLGGEVLAVFWFESYETPWVTVRVEAGAGFERFRGYFAPEEDWPEEDDRAFDGVLHEVSSRGGFRLVAEGEAELREFTLVNVDGRGGAEPEFANLRI